MSALLGRSCPALVRLSRSADEFVHTGRTFACTIFPRLLPMTWLFRSRALASPLYTTSQSGAAPLPQPNEHESSLQATGRAVICVCDTEYTKSKDQDTKKKAEWRLIEVAATTVQTGAVFNTLINIGTAKVSGETTEITRITNKMAHNPNKPKVRQALGQFIDFVEAQAQAMHSTRVVLVFHNGKHWDLPIIQAECTRVGVDLPQDWWWLDTYTLATWAKVQYDKGERRHQPPVKTGLENLCRHFKVKLPRHRALPDAFALNGVLTPLLALVDMTITELQDEEHLLKLANLKPACAGKLSDIDYVAK